MIPEMTLETIVVMTGIVVWAVRVEGKVATAEKLRKVDQNAADERHEDLKTRLTRIENKLDTFNGHAQG